MTGFRWGDSMRWNCANSGCYNASLPDWKPLMDGCFPRRIRPTDIDGMVEINHHFLFLEQKQEGATWNDAQRIAMKRLSMLPRVTVLLFRPAPGAPFAFQCNWFVGGEASGWKDVSHPDLQVWFELWSQRAEAGPQAA